MILERRANHGMLRLPKDGGGSGDQEKNTTRCDEEAKSPVAANNLEDDSHRGKPQRDETNHVASHPEVIKTGAVNSSVAEKTSPIVRKPSYNPITHVPSNSIYLTAGVFIPVFISFVS